MNTQLNHIGLVYRHNKLGINPWAVVIDNNVRERTVTLGFFSNCEVADFRDVELNNWVRNGIITPVKIIRF